MLRRPLRPSPAVLLVAACAFWGAATVVNKALLSSISPVTLLVLQLAPSALVLGIMVFITNAKAARPSLLLPLILLGILNPGISYTMSFIGLARTSASVSTLLWAAEPLMILGLATIFLREPVTWQLLAVMTVGAFGVVLVTDVVGGIGATSADLLGIALLLGAVLCCAFYTVFSRKLGEYVDPVYTVAVQQAAGLAWAVALLFVGTPFGKPGELSTISLELTAAAAVSGLLYYAAAYWLYIKALQTVPAAVAGSYFNVIPIFGVCLAFIFLGETLSPVQWAGAVVILMSVFELVRLTGHASADTSAK